MAHGPVLIPDLILFLTQLGLFLATVIVLRQLLFLPYLKLRALRREQTDGLRDKAAQLRAEAENIELEHQTFLRTEHKRLSTEMDAERRKVQEQERVVVSAARQEVDRRLEESRKIAAQEIAEARAELLPHVAEYSSQIASKLLGHSVKVKNLVEKKAPAGREEVIER